MDATEDVASTRVLLGMITPSSNTVVEPACADTLHGLSGVSAHFTRLRVTHISLDDSSSAQFDIAAMQDAASLLADAQVRSICWNGTSASWLGLQRDEALCASIRTQTGICATSASLATVELFRRAGVTRFGLVTPYTSDVQARIVANYAALGFECLSERHLGLTDNFAFAQVGASTLMGMVREVARAKPQAISILCTNLFGVRAAATLERELDIPVFDSTACAIWSALQLAAFDPSLVRGWGSLFAR